MQRKKILLVDDSPTAILMERMILEEEPYDILVAADGEECLRLAREQRPDLILLDVVMPHMDGFEALRALRADESLRGLPILMVTTRTELDDVVTGYERGANEYITKPVDPAELLAKVRSCLLAAGRT